MKKNLVLSKYWKKRTKARKGLCWNNSLAVLWQLGAEARYVEGWCRLRPELPLAIEHGWIEYQGDIIDVSLLGESVSYYAGVRYTIADVAEKLKITKKPPFVWLQHGGLVIPDYRNAYDDARGMSEEDKQWMRDIENKLSAKTRAVPARCGAGVRNYEYDVKSERYL